MAAAGSRSNLDGSPCTEDPLVEIVNDGFATAIDLNSLTVDQAASLIRFAMAQEPGAGRLTVRACGREATLSIINVGASSSSKGCPTNLLPGAYRLFVSVSGSVSIPETFAGTLSFTTPGTFCEDIDEAVQVVIVSSPQVACRTKRRYTPFDGLSFGAINVITCSAFGRSVAKVNVALRLVLI